MCLNDWASHGVSWFQCVFGASQEKKAQRVFFTEGAALREALAAVNQFCERELVHYIASVRAERLQAEIDARLAGVSYTPADAAHPPELPSLLSELDSPPLSALAPLLTFVRESHTILRSFYIFLALQYAHFDLQLHASLRTPQANTLLVESVTHTAHALTHALRSPVLSLRRAAAVAVAAAARVTQRHRQSLPEALSKLLFLCCIR